MVSTLLWRREVLWDCGLACPESVYLIFLLTFLINVNQYSNSESVSWLKKSDIRFDRNKSYYTFIFQLTIVTHGIIDFVSRGIYWKIYHWSFVILHTSWIFWGVINEKLSRRMVRLLVTSGAVIIEEWWDCTFWGMIRNTGGKIKSAGYPPERWKSGIWVLTSDLKT